MSQAYADTSYEPWPELALPTAQVTAGTLRFWTQIVGKTRLALAPPANHWWNVTLYVSARGLTTSPMPAGSDDTRLLEVEFDLLRHRLELTSSDGRAEALPLASGTLASFYDSYMAALGRLGLRVRIHPRAVEMPETVYLDRDEVFRVYDPEWARRFFVALAQAHRLLSAFRSRFSGKASPVHFFWGSFDLAVTRFSGRPAPRHPGGVPNCPDYVAEEAYSHELTSAGFWPGDERFPEAAFYAYAYPEPAGFSRAALVPAAARYAADLGEFLLPYEAVRRSATPDRDVLAFLETSYAAAAELGRWERAALERRPRASAQTGVQPSL